MKIPHIDYRKLNLPDGMEWCRKCGDVYLADLDDNGDFVLRCTNCGEIK